MKQELHTPDIICEEYDLEHDCITIEELRWILKRVGRFSPYWMLYVLRVTTGIRPDEALKLTLYHLNPALTTINYRVDKPSTILMKTKEYRQKHKHRRVTIDPWVRTQLIEYLNRTCRIVNGTYISPYPHQQLFPWTDDNKRSKATAITGAYWAKLRKKMTRAGFDSQRLIKEYRRTKRTKHDKIYVVRPHMLRHFAASVMLCKLGNIASVRDWIKHEDVEVTNGYIHGPESLGTNHDYLKNATWAAILGYDDHQGTIHGALAPDQTLLDTY